MNYIKRYNNTQNLSDIIKNDLKASKDLGLLKCLQCEMCTFLCSSVSHSDTILEMCLEKFLKIRKIL